MSILKFRALYKPTNKYADIDSIDFVNKIVVLKSYPLVRSFGLDKVDFDDVVIEQYTGLTDKNKKEIYEGDIVSFNYRCCKECPTEIYRAIIEFGNPNGLYDWGWQMKFISKVKPSNTDILLWIEMPDVECSIIGNIHDNPELLKGKEEK